MEKISLDKCRDINLTRAPRSSFPSHRFARAEIPRPAPSPLPTDLLYTCSL